MNLTEIALAKGVLGGSTALSVPSISLSFDKEMHSLVEIPKALSPTILMEIDKRDFHRARSRAGNSNRMCAAYRDWWTEQGDSVWVVCHVYFSVPPTSGVDPVVLPTLSPDFTSSAVNVIDLQNSLVIKSNEGYSFSQILESAPVEILQPQPWS